MCHEGDCCDLLKEDGGRVDGGSHCRDLFLTTEERNSRGREISRQADACCVDVGKVCPQIDETE